MTDKEKIRAEVERVKEIHESNLDKPMERGRIGYAHGVVACCDEILDFIDSLQQEQPEEMLDKDLNEAAEEYAFNNWEDNDYHTGASEGLHFDAIGHTANCFIAGAEWQKKNVGKGYDSRDMYEAYEQGRAEQKAQMMKEAVEGTYAVTTVGHFAFFPDKPIKDLCCGDKVRIIILPNE